MKKTEIKIGDRFGKYTVIELPYSKQYPSCKKVIVKCKCDCGTIREVQRQNLLFKKANQCKTCRMKQLSEEEYRRIYCQNRKLPDGDVNINGCFGGYQRGAKSRGLVFNLSKEQFLYLAQKNCTYCNSEPSNVYNLTYGSGAKKGQPRGGKPFLYNGIDRIDNNIGYTLDNCIPCCWMCNKIKSSFSIDSFISQVKRINNFYGKTHDSRAKFSA